MRYPGLNGVLDAMRTYVLKYKADPRIRSKAVAITASIAQDPRTGHPDRRNYSQVAGAVYNWVNHNIAYVRDPDAVEYLQSPPKTLQYGYGDCDDLATLSAALLSSIGVPTRFKVVKADPRNRGSFSHVYVEYLDRGEWIPFDITLHSHAGAGIADSAIYGKRTVTIDDLPEQPLMQHTLHDGDLGLTLPTIDLNQIGKQITGDLGFPKVTGSTPTGGTASGPYIPGSYGEVPTFPSAQEIASQVAQQQSAQAKATRGKALKKWAVITGGALAGGIAIYELVKHYN